MLRFAVILIVIGGFLGYEGYKEYMVGQGAGSEPVIVDLAQLEQGADPPSPYIRIEDHIACDFQLVYQWEGTTGETQPSPTSKLTHCYYPIISMEHPAAEELFRYVEAGDFNAPPPLVTDYRVLVKTHRIETYGELTSPGGYTLPDVPEGLIVNKIERISDEEQDLLRQSFPGLDLDKILILEEGRTPSAAGMWAAMLGGGALLVLGGLFLLIKPALANRAARSSPAPAMDEA